MASWRGEECKALTWCFNLLQDSLRNWNCWKSCNGSSSFHIFKTVEKRFEEEKSLDFDISSAELLSKEKKKFKEILEK